MQEFVNKQLPGWIQEGVSSGLRNLPPPPPTLMIEQIREVVREEQPQPNPFEATTEKARVGKARQKEKEIFEQWMKELTEKAEEAMKKTMEEQAK
jgi:hypothetical protein